MHRKPPTPLIRVLVEIKNILNRLVESVSDSLRTQDRNYKIGIPRDPEDAIKLPVEVAEYYRAEKENHHRANRRENIRLGLEIAGVVAAVALAVLTLCTLRIFNGQLAEMKRQTVNSERAWVGLNGTIVLDSIKPLGSEVTITGHYNIENFGRGPAVKVVQSALFLDPSLNLEMQKREANSLCDGVVEAATGTIPMGGGLKQPGRFGFTLFPNQYDSESIEERGPVAITKFLQFVGCVAYIDQFNVVHWTRFCMWRSPGDTSGIPRLHFCSLYNDAGDGQSPP